MEWMRNTCMVAKETKTKKTASIDDGCQVILPKDLSKCDNVKITIENKKKPKIDR